MDSPFLRRASRSTPTVKILTENSPPQQLVQQSYSPTQPVAAVSLRGSSSSPLASTPGKRNTSVAETLIVEHDTMAKRFDEHCVRRRNIDGLISDIGDALRRIQRTVVAPRDTAQESAQDGDRRFSSSSPRKEQQQQQPSIADASLSLLARLECDHELLLLHSRGLQDMKAQKAAQCAQLEQAIAAEDKQWGTSQDRRMFNDVQASFADCVSAETRLRSEENRLLESLAQAERSGKDAEARRKKLTARQEEIQRQTFDLESSVGVLKSQAVTASETLQQKRIEKETWEQRLSSLLNTNANENSPTSLVRLQQQRDACLDELRNIDRLSTALRQSEAESLEDPNHAMITNSSRPLDETAAIIWDVTRPVRSVLSLRDTLLVLKAQILNLYEDFEEIVETVERVQAEPQCSMYPAFSEQSNQWRQQKLYDAFDDVVKHMKGKAYVNDAAAARALLAKLKYFVVVYDMFENHYDAVVNAIMLSDEKWAEAETFVEAATICRKHLNEPNRRASVMKRRGSSTVSASPPNTTTLGPNSRAGSMSSLKR